MVERKKGLYVNIGGVPTDLLAGMLDAVTHPPTGFISNRQFTLSDIGRRAESLPWGSRCGQDPPILGVSMPVVWLGSASEASKALEAPEWETAQLEAQNQLTLWLHRNVSAAYSSWNERVMRTKAALIEPLGPTLLVLHRRLGLPESLVHSVQWDILGAVMENEYLPEGHSTFFFLELLEVYEAGRLPCGWVGQWPAGQLRVY